MTILTLPDTWIQAAEAAKRLGMSHTHVRRLVLRGELPAIKTPYGFLVDAADIERMRVEREAERVKKDEAVVT